MDAALYSAGYLIVILVAFLALKPLDKRLTMAFGLAFVAYLVLDDWITGLPYAVPVFDLNPAHWNWAGKVYSLLFSVAVILGFKLDARAIGLALPTHNVRLGAVVTLLLIPLGIVLALRYKPEIPDAETLAFQLLMPGLAEELAFRGIAPALLLGLVRGKTAAREIPWAVIVIAAIPFGVMHGLGFSEGAFSFAVEPALWTFTGGIAYGWLRFSTGSLLFPLLAHSLANVAFHLTPLMRG